jgi:hypothetical protein
METIKLQENCRLGIYGFGLCVCQSESAWHHAVNIAHFVQEYTGLFYITPQTPKGQARTICI